jgi:transcription initiation factor IIE alpha subunit
MNFLKRIFAYHNTTAVSESELKSRTDKAKAQNMQIMEIFRSNPKDMMSASDIHRKTGILITSVRRSLTWLHQGNQITRVGRKRNEETGALEFTYLYHDKLSTL